MFTETKYTKQHLENVTTILKGINEHINYQIYYKLILSQTQIKLYNINFKLDTVSIGRRLRMYPTYKIFSKFLL